MKDINKIKLPLMKWAETRYKRAVLALSFVVGISSVSNAQVKEYSFAQTSGTYTALSGGTILGEAVNNSGTGTLNSENFPVTGLPFSFVFNGVAYNELNVNTNGFLTFGTTLPTVTTTTPISSTIAYDGAVSAFGRDLIGCYDISGVTANIQWGVVGTAPNREIVIQWTNVRPTNVTTTTSVYTFSFQIRLKETSNAISVVYKDGSYLVGSTSYSSTAQIGLRGFTNTDYNNRLNATTLAFTASTPGTTSSSSQAFNTVNATPGMPPAGLTYTWTPPSCLAPNGISASTITANSATISWATPAATPANGYDVYYSTSNTAPTASTLLDGTNSVTAAASATSATINGLTPNTQYYVWVRAKCGTSDMSSWSTVYDFRSKCLPMTSMFEDFESYATGSIVPYCWDRIVPATTPGAQTISSTTPASGTKNMYQNTSSTQNSVIVVLPEFSNINAGTHQLRFKARALSAGGILTVGYVTEITDGSSFTPIQTLTLNNTVYTTSDAEYTVIVPNTVPANARLAIKNAADGISCYWDDVYWETIPTCFVPTGVTISNAQPTSIDVSWTAPVNGTPTGYDIYYTTTNTAPTSSTILNATNSVTSTTTSVTINGLTPTTPYCVWVRTNCGTNGVSDWDTFGYCSATFCQPPALTGTTGATVCPNGTAILSATAATGVTINWYDATIGGNQVGTGTSFTTPALTATTNYWATAANIGTPTSVGPTTPASLGTSSNSNTNWDLLFTVNSNLKLNSVDVFSGTAGQAGNIEILNASGIAIATFPFTTTGAGTSTPQTVALNLDLPPGNYSMRRSGAANLHRNSVGAVFPYTTPELVITGTTFGLPPNNYIAYYFYFYNLNFTPICESPRTQVTATVDTNCMGTSEADLAKSVKVHPNPFKDVLHISDVDNVKSITIMDASGRLVKTIEKVSATLNLSDLKEGLYLVNLNYKDEKSTSVKVIKK